MDKEDSSLTNLSPTPSLQTLDSINWSEMSEKCEDQGRNIEFTFVLSIEMLWGEGSNVRIVDQHDVTATDANAS